MRLLRFWIAILFVFWLSGCAHIVNLPINLPTVNTNGGFASDMRAGGRPADESADDYLIGLAFSGGGTRAAAFSFGVLRELDRAQVTKHYKTVGLLDRLDFVSGVSGGSVTAAYYGLKKRAALADVRERFLIKDAEEDLSTNVSLINLGRAFGVASTRMPGCAIG